jgi:hypothetical protein
VEHILSVGSGGVWQLQPQVGQVEPGELMPELPDLLSNFPMPLEPCPSDILDNA